MEDRPKRAVNKPMRYKTTSSDEGPAPKKAAPASNTAAGGIEEDIQNIRATLDKDTNSDINSMTNPTHTQNIPSHIHIPIHTTPTGSARSSQETLFHTHPSYTPYENEQLYYTNNTYTELQVNSRKSTMQDNMHHQLPYGQHEKQRYYGQYEERLPYGQHAQISGQITQKADNRYVCVDIHKYEISVI